MKKAISILMTLALVFGMCTVTASAVSSDAVITLESNAARADIGDVITVSVNVKTDSALGLGAMSLELLYDTSAFEYVADTLKATDYFDYSVTREQKAGCFLYAGIQERAVTTDGTLLTAQFKVLNPGGSIQLNLTEVGLGDYDTTIVTSVVAANSTTEITIGCNHGSTSDTIIKMPTCTEDGLKKGICQVCGEEVLKVIPAHGHKVENDIWKIVKEPTCTEDGEKVQLCTICGEILNQETLPATGHTFGEWTVTKEPTCTQIGEETHTCACGVAETREIDATGHTAGEWKITQAPTCTEDGEQVQVCEVCGEILNRKPIPAHGHTPGEWVVTKEPTLTEEGEKVQTCTVCGEIVATQIIEKLHGMLGDVNGDGKITAVDARWILQAASDTRTFTDEQNLIGDLNEDGKITAVDARWALQIASGTRPNPNV